VRNLTDATNNWEYVHIQRTAGIEELKGLICRDGRFGFVIGIAYFPLWYPALIFALAGVAALRFRHQFSIRSALITVSVVAALLGMAAVL
jgi:hypothetical protein